jgi:RND family efflux transporter MFP subunit
VHHIALPIPWGRRAVDRLPLPLACAVLGFLPSCKKQEVAPPPPPVVAVMDIHTSAVPLQTTLIGQLDSPQNVQVRARVEGFVDEMLFIEGSEVTQGDVLFQLDRKPFLERLAAAEGALAEAKAALHKYEKDVARLQPLAQRKAIPQQDLDNALASVDVGQAGVTTAQARVQTAQLDLGYCEITAPVSGLIGAKQVSIGELVGKGEPTLMTTISTLDPIWFYCNVSEVEYLKAREKSKETGAEIETLPLTLVLSNGQDHPDKGRFVFIDRAVDSKTGTLRVRAEFPNPEKLLRPGMFARVRVDLGTRKNCIVIPQRALIELQGKSFVWVLSEEGNVHQTAVRVGEQVGSGMIVLEGLRVGDRILVEGTHKVREGMPVTVAPAASQAETRNAEKQ